MHLTGSCSNKKSAAEKSSVEKFVFRNQAPLLGASISMSAILALPAFFYLATAPDLSKVLSLILSLTFYFFLLFPIRNRVFLIGMGLLVLLLNIIEIVHIAAYGSLISLGAIEGIFYSDPGEMKEFIMARAGLILLYVMVISTYVWLACIKSRKDSLPFKTKLFTGAICLAVSFCLLSADIALSKNEKEIFLPVRIFEHYTRYLGLNPVTNTLSGLTMVISHRKKLEELTRMRKTFSFNSRQNTSRKGELYIIIVGESSRRRNWSLYGYKRPTNYNLSQIDNIILFEDAVSAGVTTSLSVPLSFSLATPDDFDLFYHTKSLPAGFSELGYRTFWISNQGQYSTVDTPTSLIMQESDHTISTNFGFGNVSFDDVMLPELERVLGLRAPKKLIVLHTMGSHTNYAQRIPETFTLTGPDVPIRSAHTTTDLTKGRERVIRSYDNTIAYTDWLVSQVIKMHSKTNTYGGVIYFSDHGQRLYDNSKGEKGHGFASPSRFDVDIPFFIWLSDAFMAADPRKARTIKDNRKRPVSTGDFIYSMFDLADIQTDFDNKTRSFFNRDYKPAPRKILLLNKKTCLYDKIPCN